MELSVATEKIPSDTTGTRSRHRPTSSGVPSPVRHPRRSQIATHHVTKHNTPIHNILSTVPQLSTFQKALGMLPKDGNVMPKHVGTTIHN
jgi:hypothetical protein